MITTYSILGVVIAFLIWLNIHDLRLIRKYLKELASLKQNLELKNEFIFEARKQFADLSHEMIILKNEKYRLTKENEKLESKVLLLKTTKSQNLN